LDEAWEDYEPCFGEFEPRHQRWDERGAGSRLKRGLAIPMIWSPVLLAKLKFSKNQLLNNEKYRAKTEKLKDFLKKRLNGLNENKITNEE
jgi:hypothetical protein